METVIPLEIGRKVLAAQPFSLLLGTTLEAFSYGSVVLRLPIRDAFLQQNGFVHGGVLSYAADSALTFAGGSVLGPNVLTSEYKINYVRPAIGKSLVARGTVVYGGRRQAVCRCDIHAVDANGEEKLCATAQGTIVAVSPPGAPREADGS